RRRPGARAGLDGSRARGRRDLATRSRDLERFAGLGYDPADVDLDAVARRARDAFDGKMAARERALSASRRAIRSSANAIRALHRLERDRARELTEEARA